MKNLRPDFNDSLRPEYKRSDFGEMVRGSRVAVTQVDFAELVNLLMGCISEDEGVDFTHYSIGNTLAGHEPGDWTYEIDNGNQITLRYWITEFESIEESISNPPCLYTYQELSDLNDLIQEHVRLLKTKARAS